MRLLNLRINSYLLRTFCPHLGSFLCCFFFHYVSAKFRLCPSSGDLPRPRIWMLSLVTVSPVITVFHSCCLSHHVVYRTIVVVYRKGFIYIYNLLLNSPYQLIYHKTQIKPNWKFLQHQFKKKIKKETHPEYQKEKTSFESFSHF